MVPNLGEVVSRSGQKKSLSKMLKWQVRLGLVATKLVPLSTPPFLVEQTREAR